MKNVLKFIFVTIICLLILVFFVTMYFGYEKTILLFSIDSSKIDKIFALITARKFLIFQIINLVTVVGFLLLLLMLDQIVTFFQSVSIFIKRNIQVLIIELRVTGIKWLLILPVFSSFFFAIIMPVSYDEAFTYLQFTSKSILVSLSFYPAPNNHVLHSMITNITRYIPFLSVLLCLRISSIIVSFLTWLLCFSFIKKYYSENISLIITGIASMLFMSIYYSYMSRGYGLVLFFFVLSLYASYCIIFNNDKKKYWLLFSISNVFGFFTIPSFLYAFIMLNAFVLWNNKWQLKNQFMFNFFAIFLVVILYLPIIIVNGLGAITSNQFVLPINRFDVVSYLFEFFKNTIIEIVGFNYIFICLLLIASAAMMLKFKMKFEFKAIVIFICFPFLLLIAHSIIPFPRTFNYYVIVLVFLSFIPYWRIVKDVSKSVLISIVLCVQFALFFNFFSNIKKYETFNIPYHEINTKIIGDGSYYFSSNLFEVNFIFENIINGYTMSKAKYNFPQVNIDVDTLSGYDYYIIDKKYDFTKNKKPVFSDGPTNVYSK